MISSVLSVVTVAILSKNVHTPGSPAKCIWLFNRQSREQWVQVSQNKQVKKQLKFTTIANKHQGHPSKTLSQV